jgi:hypothetical protein
VELAPTLLHQLVLRADVAAFFISVHERDRHGLEN